MAPIFSRIPARIIEPTVGASTWALGSQTCNRKRGSLIMKAKPIIRLKTILLLNLLLFSQIMIATRSGLEKRNV